MRPAACLNAAPTRFMTHLSLVEVDEKGNSATWGTHVGDEEYRAAPPSRRRLDDEHMDE